MVKPQVVSFQKRKGWLTPFDQLRSNKAFACLILVWRQGRIYPQTVELLASKASCDLSEHGYISKFTVEWWLWVDSKPPILASETPILASDHGLKPLFLALELPSLPLEAPFLAPESQILVAEPQILAPEPPTTVPEPQILEFETPIMDYEP